jgi:transcriptional regulator GlxA family with amidase domain
MPLTDAVQPQGNVPRTKRSPDALAATCEPQDIGFYLTPGFAALDLSGLLEVFTTSALLHPTTSYRMTFVSLDGGTIQGSGGLLIASAPAGKQQFDTLLVIGGQNIPERTQGDLDAIRSYAASARRVASTCTGVYLLAAAGFLAGRRVTTHWKDAAKLQTDFPSLQVETDRIFVRDGPIWSSAGMSAGIDLALALVEEDHGAELARSVARHLVVEHRRHGGQSQDSALLSLDPPSDRMARTLAYIRGHLQSPLTVQRLAAVAGLSPRQFSRSFRLQCGETPARAVERLRVEASKARIVHSREPIEAIAMSLGFADPERMRRAFVRRFGRSPRDFRRSAFDAAQEAV